MTAQRLPPGGAGTPPAVPEISPLSPPPPPAASASPLRGVVLMSVAMLMLPAIDAIAKSVGDRIPVPQIVFGRFLFQSIAMTALALWLLPAAARRPHRLTLNLLRGLLIAAATVLFFSALQHMPMAESIAIFFVEPLILTVLAALFLGEAIGWRRVGAVVAGFVGAMLIIRPAFSEIGPAALLPLGTALCFALYLLLTKKLVADTHPIAIQLFTGLSALLVMSLALALGHWGLLAGFAPIALSPADWAWLALLGAIASLGHLLVVFSFSHAPASTLAPLQYLEIVSATAFGYWLFGDFPDAIAWLGVAIIVGAGLFVAWRERVRAAA